jgi:cell cycle checkpoint protein
VLNASVHDVRYFTALLRGINFGNVSSTHVRTRHGWIDSRLQRATVTITKAGLIVSVEEARTVLGPYL